MLFHQTICFLYQGMQWKKRFIHFTSLQYTIQNGHHKITEVIIFSLIIEIVTRLFNRAICFRYQ